MSTLRCLLVHTCLEDRLPPFPKEAAFEIIRQELGVPFDEVFELVEPEPIAAASIGQVFKGRLVANGTIKSLTRKHASSSSHVTPFFIDSLVRLFSRAGDLVAIKIQRPGCEEIISVDLYIMRWYAGLLTWLLEKLGRKINLVSVIDDFGELIYREIDYTAEASNAQLVSTLLHVVYTRLQCKKICIAKVL